MNQSSSFKQRASEQMQGGEEHQGFGGQDIQGVSLKRRDEKKD